MGQQIVDAFNTDAYNIVCICSSSIGVLGAIYQVKDNDHYNPAYSFQFQTDLLFKFLRFYHEKNVNMHIDGYQPQQCVVVK